MCGVKDTDLCMRCNLRIFSGCVCHLEQLNAQSPFVFSIVVGVNTVLQRELPLARRVPIHLHTLAEGV